MFRHEGVGNLAVPAECARGADLIKAHEPRVACHVGCNYSCQPASDTAWLLLLHGQAARGDIMLPEMLPDASLSLGRCVVNKWNRWLPEECTAQARGSVFSWACGPHQAQRSGACRSQDTALRA